MKNRLQEIVEHYERQNASILSNLDGDYRDDLTYAEGGVNPGQQFQACVRPPAVAKPYKFTVTNTSGDTANAILFGSFWYADAVNYGSAAGVTVKVRNTVANYAAMLQQMYSNPFHAGLWRFSSSTANQLDQEIIVSYKNANGKAYDDPIDLSVYINTFQNIATIASFEYDIWIDGNTYITVPILNGATLNISVFPLMIGDMRGNKEFETPIVDGMVNVSKVVPMINSRQPVVAGRIAGMATAPASFAPSRRV